MSEALEPLEGVVDKDPVLVRLPGVIVGWGSCKKQIVETDVKWGLGYFQSPVASLVIIIKILYIYCNPLEYSCIPPYILIIPPLKFYGFIYTERLLLFHEG